MDIQHPLQSNLETPLEVTPEESQLSKDAHTPYPSSDPSAVDQQSEPTRTVEQTDNMIDSEFTSGFYPEKTESADTESEPTPNHESEPTIEEPINLPKREDSSPAEPQSPEPFMPEDAPLDDELYEIDDEPEIPISIEPLDKSYLIAAGVRIAAVSLISIFFMRLFGGAGSTCSTTALPLNYACSLNYLWLAVLGVCVLAILERVISKMLHKRYSHAMPVAGFVLATFTFYQVSQLFAALSSTQQKQPTISLLHFMPMLITITALVIGLLLAHFIRARKVMRFTAVAFPITALILVIILPIVLTEHFTTLMLAKQVRSEQTIKTNLKNTSSAAAAAGVNLYMPKNYSGPLQIKYIKPFFKAGDYPRYVMTYQLPTGKNLEMSIHKKDPTNNPPVNCGDFLPYTIKPSTKLASLAFPCKLIVTAKEERKVYGFYDSSITDTIKLDSKDISKYQPSAYYIYIDNTVISFLDTTALSGQASTITPEVTQTFVDSLQLYKDKELQDIIDKYGV